VMQSVPGSASSHCSEWLFLVSAQKHSLHSCCCREGTWVCKFSGSRKRCRGLCKVLRLYSEGSRVRECCCVFTCFPLQLGSVSHASLLLQKSTVYTDCSILCSGCILGVLCVVWCCSAILLSETSLCFHCCLDSTDIGSWQPGWGWEAKFLQQAGEEHLSWDFDIKLCS